MTRPACLCVVTPSRNGKPVALEGFSPFTSYVTGPLMQQDGQCGVRIPACPKNSVGQWPGKILTLSQVSVAQKLSEIADRFKKVFKLRCEACALAR